MKTSRLVAFVACVVASRVFAGGLDTPVKFGMSHRTFFSGEYGPGPSPDVMGDNERLVVDYAGNNQVTWVNQYNYVRVSQRMTPEATLPLYFCRSTAEVTDKSAWVYRASPMTYNDFFETHQTVFLSNVANCYGRADVSIFVGYVVPPENALAYENAYHQRLDPIVSCAHYTYVRQGVYGTTNYHQYGDVCDALVFAGFTTGFQRQQTSSGFMPQRYTLSPMNVTYNLYSQPKPGGTPSWVTFERTVAAMYNFFNPFTNLYSTWPASAGAPTFTFPSPAYLFTDNVVLQPLSCTWDPSYPYANLKPWTTQYLTGDGLCSLINHYVRLRRESTTVVNNPPALPAAEPAPAPAGTPVPNPSQPPCFAPGQAYTYPSRSGTLCCSNTIASAVSLPPGLGWLITCK